MTTPSDRDSAAGVARYYGRHHPGLVDTFVLDAGDAADAEAVAATGMAPVLAPVLDPDGLAAAVAGLLEGPHGGRSRPLARVAPAG